jgi:23S rRNA (uracil1939-C5)-methyltransferase
MIKKCVHFPVCGGCTILDKDYDVQIEEKKNALVGMFNNYNLDSVKVIKSPQPFYYRHKVQLPFSSVNAGKSRRIILGCYATDSHSVINQTECMIQDKELTLVAHAVRDWAIKTGLPVYNEKTGNGFLRHVLLRKASGTGEILIGIVTNGDRVEGSRTLSRLLLDMVGKRIGDISKIVGIVQNVNKRDTNVVLGEKENVWWGRPYIKEMLGDLRFKLEMSTFFQVNPYQTPNLYNEVKSAVPSGAKVLDLYCGVGSITLWLASKVKEIAGIEENRASIAAAKTAASLNEITNAKFFAGDVTSMLPDFIGAGYDHIIVDPPRKGLDKKGCDLLLDASCKRIVYVSCNPQSLKRDMEFLSAKYRLGSLTGVDMFPHTDHLESVAVLERRI